MQAMSVTSRKLLLSLAVSGLAALGGISTADAGDPPAFGLVSVGQGQTVRMNVFCYPPGPTFPPGPSDVCHGSLTSRGIGGRLLGTKQYTLDPGQGTSFEFVHPPANLGDLNRSLSISPGIMPDPGSGPGIPTAEVVDNDTGRAALFVNPASVHVSDFVGPPVGGVTGPQ